MVCPEGSWLYKSVLFNRKASRVRRLIRFLFTARLNLFLLTLMAIRAGYSPGWEDFFSTIRKGYFTKLDSEVSNSSINVLLHKRSDLLSEYIEETEK